MKYSIHNLKTDLKIIIPTIVVSFLVFMALPLFCGHCLVHPPDLPSKAINDSESMMNYSISLISGTVSMVGLIISLLGVFITMLVITVGNYRQQFYDTLWKCNNPGNEKYINKKTLEAIAHRHERLNKTAKPLQNVFRVFVGIAIFGLFFCAIFMIFQEWAFDSLWRYIWLFVSIFIFLLFVMTTYICLRVLSTVSYVEMKNIRTCLAG